MFGCEAALKSVLVAEQFHDQVISKVQVFSLARHPRATRCYAWYGTERQPSVMLRLRQVMDAVPRLPTTRAEVARDGHRCGPGCCYAATSAHRGSLRR